MRTQRGLWRSFGDFFQLQFTSNSKSCSLSLPGSLQITWQEIMVGVESGLLMFPINILIITIFRSIRPRVVSKNGKANSERNLRPFAVTVPSILKVCLAFRSVRFISCGVFFATFSTLIWLCLLSRIQRRWFFGWAEVPETSYQTYTGWNPLLTCYLPWTGYMGLFSLCKVLS